LYGKSALAFGTGPKRDGGLMCSGADWKNSQQQATNMSSPNKKANQESGSNCKDRKYQHLSSNVFGDVNHDAPVYDSNSARAIHKSNANWNHSQSKPNNKSWKIDTYTERKK